MTTVTMHSEMGREGHPAVNIKIHAGPARLGALLPLALGSSKGPDDAEFTEHVSEPGFTLEWIDEHLAEAAQYGWWEVSCQDHFEQAKDLAQETFGAHVEVYSEGRSGGWLVVHGLGDVEDWTEAEVAAWTEFAEQVRAIADDVPYGYLWNIYANVWEAEQEQAAAEAAEVERARHSAAVTEGAIEAFRTHEKRRLAADRAGRDLSLSMVLLAREGNEVDRLRYFEQTTAILAEFEEKRAKENLV